MNKEKVYIVLFVGAVSNVVFKGNFKACRVWRDSNTNQFTRKLYKIYELK